MPQAITVRILTKDETPAALRLVWQVFQAFEAPDYTPEGVEEFHKTIQNDEFMSKLCLYGAFLGQELVGVIATRSEGTHIALFFVDGRYHRQGIGRQLFEKVWEQCPSDYMTVNSSPYAVPIYHRFGFQDTDTEQVVNGLRFTPMRLTRFVSAKN